MSPKLASHLGVVIVTYNSADVVQDCLESLSRSERCDLRIVVVDNASTDDTLNVVRRIVSPHSLIEFDPEPGSEPLPVLPPVSLVKSIVNLGFAGGVNLGLRHLLLQPDLEFFWVLNPDCTVEPDSAAKFVARANATGKFGLMGGRILYHKPCETIQSDGGQVSRWTGMCRNINLSKGDRDTPYPSTKVVDYISGASFLTCREFVEKVGFMREDYFLYYEEVDWAFRRQDFKLVTVEGARTIHRVGTSIGSPLVGKEQGTAFSNYFNYRNRIRFMRRFFPFRLPVAYAYSMLKVVRLILQGHLSEADGAFRGLLDLRPPKAVQMRLGPEAYRLAYGNRPLAASPRVGPL